MDIRKEFQLHDKVAFKSYEDKDNYSSICGSIVAIKDNWILFFPEKSEYGISKENLKDFKKIKETCDICLKQEYVKVYRFYTTGCHVYYVCNHCLKKIPNLKNLFNIINDVDISPRAIADKTVVTKSDFWQKILEERINETFK